MNIRKTIAAATILLCAGLAFAKIEEGPAISAEREGIRVYMTGGAGPIISVDGLPFVNASTFFVVKENWNGRWFGYSDDREAVSAAKRSKTPEGGDRFDMIYRSQDDIVVTSQSIELLPGRVVRLGVDLLVTTTTQAIFEHQMGGINPAWVAGRPFTVSGPDAKTSFTVAPGVPKQAEMLDAAIAAHFDKMTIDTRMGPLEIIAKGGAKPCVLDYRAHKYAKLTPHYWIGILAQKVTPNEVLSYSVEFRFPPARAAAAKPIEVDAKPRDEARVLGPLETPDRIFPTPKKVDWSKFNFSLNADTTIRIDAANADEIKPAVDGFINYVKKNFGLTLKMSEKPSPRQIVLTCKDGSVSVTEADNQEQYVVKIGDTVRASANTSAGLMNAVKTLQQLVRGEGEKVSMRGCAIEDWPAMPYRGIHFFSGNDARELQLKMVRDILGALKINNICYQSEYVKWDATSKVHHEKYGMSKDDAQAVVEECVRQGIEITPLINLFGHSEWLIANKVYSHLADNPNHPYAYDPSNPEVYELTEKILIEVLDFFKPNVLHIGHDEIAMEGFPSKEANKAVGTTELILKDIMHYYDFLHARGVRTMMWGDMFIAPSEGDAAHAPDVKTSTLRRDRLPKDVIIADWHYDPSPVEKYPSLKMFNDAGFDALACPWFDPVNVVNFTRAAGLQWEATKDVKNEEGTPRKGQTLGILDTTWAGYSFGQESFDENQDQYAAYFLAAEASWTGAEKSYDKWDFDYRTEFARMWSGSDLPRGEQAGWTIDLNKAANFTAVTGEKKDFLGNEGVTGMDNLPVGKQTLGRFTYEIPGEKGAPKAVLLAAKMNPAGEWPSAVTIPIGRSAASIGFATAATLGGPTHPPIAKTVVTFDDGTTDTFDWKLGQTAFAVDDVRASATSLVIWKDTPEGEPAKVLHQYVWRNPTPDKKVRSVRIESNQQASGLMLFGVSGISAH